MVRELINLFQSAKQQHPQLFSNSYAFKEGIYVRLEVDKPFSQQIPNLQQETMIVTKKGDTQDIGGNPISPQQKQWFQFRDINGEVLNNDSNKYLDLPNRLIASVVPTAFFMKKDVLLGTKPVGGAKVCLTPSVIQQRLQDYYSQKLSVPGVLEQWDKLVPKKQSLDFNQSYPDIMQYLHSQTRQDIFDDCEKWITTELISVISWIEKQNFGNYVRLFFDYADPKKQQTVQNNVETDYQLYVLPKLFNKNDFNVIVNNQILGYPMFQNSLNDDKPFKKGLDRHTSAPVLAPLSDMNGQKEFYDWLQVKPYFTPISLTEIQDQNNSGIHGQRFVLKNTDGIEDMDYIPFDKREVFALSIPNYLYVTFPSGKTPISKIVGKDAFQSFYHQLFFNKKVGKNYLKEEPKQQGRDFTSNMVNHFYNMNHGMFDFFEKDYEETWKSCFTDPTRQLFFELFKRPNTSYETWIEGLYIFFSMREYFGDERVEKLRTFIDKLYQQKFPAFKNDPTTYNIENEDEFFFLAGQLAMYLVSQSKALESKYDVLEPIFRCNKVDRLTDQLKFLFETYKHEIFLGHKKFNALFHSILAFSRDENMQHVKIDGKNQDWLLAGIFGQNVLYMK